MGFRGETIGTAYIRILASGSGLDQSIKDEFKDIEPLFESAGMRSDQAYRRGMKKQRERNDPILLNLEKDIKRQFGKIDQDAQDFGQDFQDRMREAISEGLKGTPDDRHATEVADRVLNEINARINSGHSVQRLKNSFRGLLAKAIGDIKADEIRNVGNAISDLNKDITAWGQGVQNTGYKVGIFAKRIEDMRAGLDPLHKNFASWSRDLDLLAIKLRKTDEHVRSTDSWFAKLADTRARNNFVNLVNIIVGKVGQLGEELGKKVGSVIENLTTNLGFASESFGKLAGSIAAVVTIAVGFGAALGPLVAGVAALGGALIGLVSTLAFAASAAIPVLIGGLTALGAVAGGVALAIAGWKEFPTVFARVTNAVQPLIGIFQRFALTTARLVTGPLVAAMPAITAAFAGLAPLVVGIGRVLGSVVGQIGAVFSGPDWKAFSDVVNKELPTIAGVFGETIASALDAFLGLVRASLPITQQFAGWLAGIAAAFASWVNSTQGQGALASFFSAAAGSAQVLWNVITKVWAVVSDLLVAGKGAGDTLWSSLAATFATLDKFLKDNKNGMRDFFGDSVAIAQALGTALVQAGQALGSLNTGPNRDAILGIVTALGDVLDAIGKVVDALSQGLGPAMLAIGAAAPWIGKAAIAIAQLIEPLVRAGALVGAFGLALGVVGGIIASQLPKILLWGRAFLAQGKAMIAMRGAAGALGIGLTLLGGKIEQTHQKLGELVSAVGVGLTAFAATGNPLIGVIAGVGTELVSLVGHLGDVSGAEREAQQATDDYSKTLDKQSGSVTQATAKMAAHRVAVQGISGDLKTAGINGGDFVDSITGGQMTSGMTKAINALTEVNNQAQRLGDSKGTVVPALSAQTQAWVDLHGGIDKVREIAPDILKVWDAETTGTQNATQNQKEHNKQLQQGNELYSQFQKNTQHAAVSQAQLNKVTNQAGFRGSIDGLQQVTASGITAKNTLDSVTYAVNNLANAFLARRGDARGYQASIDALTASIAQNGKTLNIHTEAGRENQAALDAIASAGTKVASSMKDWQKQQTFLGTFRQQLIDSAKAAGDNQTQAEAYADKIISKVKPALDKAGTSAHDAAGKTDDLNTKLKDLPTTVSPKVQLEGMDGALATTNALWQTLNDIDGMQVSASVTITRINKVLNQAGLAAGPTASGGVFLGPTTRLIGEAGPEAVVPLSRPLSQVDPAVRWLSSVAQGLSATTLASSPATKTIEVGGITVITPSQNPVTVATETVNLLAARASL